MPDIKRQTAYKITIQQILEGKYIQRQGWEPNYIESNNLQISRINLLAVLVEKQGNNLTVDDGTAKISLMLFTEQQKADNISVGDILLIVGRPREYNEKRYIVPEIIKKIQNKAWIKYRKKELEIQDLKVPKRAEEKKIPETKEIPLEKPDNFILKILDAIRAVDKGDGADTDKVIKECKVKDAEKHITTLLNEGEIFEIRPGKLKILE